jgi:hypothetical protein
MIGAWQAPPAPCGFNRRRWLPRRPGGTCPPQANRRRSHGSWPARQSATCSCGASASTDAGMVSGTSVGPQTCVAHVARDQRSCGSISATPRAQRRRARPTGARTAGLPAAAAGGGFASPAAGSSQPVRVTGTAFVTNAFAQRGCVEGTTGSAGPRSGVINAVRAHPAPGASATKSAAA